MIKLFISYRTTDSDYVDPIIAQLRSLKTKSGANVYAVWQDKDSIPAGQDWWEAICEGIESCDVFIFMLSEDSIKSAACIAELSYADKLNVPIIPFVLVGQAQYNAGGKYDISFWNDIPRELQDDDNRAQFLFQEGVSYVKRLATGIKRILQNPLPRFRVAPPPDPRHANDANNNVTVIYTEAYDFAFRKEFETAKRLFRKIVKRRDSTFGRFSYDWVNMINEYQDIHKMLSHEATRDIGHSRLISYTRQFPTDFVTFFDPLNLVDKVAEADPVETTVSSDSRIIDAPAKVELASTIDKTKVRTQQEKIPLNVEAVVPTSTPVFKQTKPRQTQNNLRIQKKSKSKEPSVLREGSIPFVAVLSVISLLVFYLMANLSSADFALAEQGVNTNAEWTHVSQRFNDVEMVLVPVGCVVIGSEEGQDEELNGNLVCFDEPFWIDRIEVTNEQYGSVGCEQSSSELNQPRNCVSWFDAQAYCQARDARLPSETEWEYAARGPDNLIYPWGNEWVLDNAVYSANSGSRTAPVASRPAGASWVGALDMSGNVWEWTSSLYEVYPYASNDGSEDDIGERIDIQYILRGGSFFYASLFLQSANRIRSDPMSEFSNYGFRCARSYGE